MTLNPSTGASGPLDRPTRRGSSALAALAVIAVLLVAACGPGAPGSGAPGAALPTVPGSPAGAVRPIASAPAAVPDASSAAVPDASSAAAPTAVSSPTAPAIVGPARTPAPSTAATTPVPSATAAAVVVPSLAPPAIDPRADGLDIACGEVAITLETAAIRPGPVTLIIGNAGHQSVGFEMKIQGSGGSGGDRTKIETRAFRSGETLRVEADLPPGVYEIECSMVGQASNDMQAALVVRADAPFATARAGTAGSATVRIVQFAFVAASLDVAAGTRVTWINEDPVPHTVTAEHGAFDSRQLDPGASFSFVLETPGLYPYQCEIHRTMVGTVVVH